MKNFLYHILPAVIALLPIALHAQQPDMELADTIASSKVTSDRLTERNSTQMGLEHIDKGKLLRGITFMGTPDVIKTLQNLPGVSSGSELMSGLYVHGGDGTDNLFLLDGIPIYQVSHLGGLFSSFNTDIVHSLDFYKSGFPGRYGGRLSSVVDVRTEDGDFQKYNGTFSLGMIDGRIQFGGPIVRDKLSFNAAIRRSWLEVLTIPIFAVTNAIAKKQRGNKTSANYNFYDANACLTWLATARSRMTARFYIGGDDMKLKASIIDSEIPDNSNYNYIIKGNVNWGNILGSLTWETRFNQNLKLSSAVYYSRNHSKIIFGAEVSESEGSNMSTRTYERNFSVLDELGVKADIIWSPHRSHILRAGLKYSWDRYSPRHTWDTDIVLSGHSANLRRGSNGTLYHSNDIAIYAEDEMTLASWLKINAGFRYSPFFVRGKTWHLIEPRAALQFICADFLSIKASYTQMNQPVHLVATTYIDLPTNCWMPSTSRIPPAHSDQIAAGIYTHLPHGIEFNVEGYYKSMANLYEFNGFNSDILSPLDGIFPPLDSWETEFTKGRGRSYGMEAELSWKTGKVDLSAYYTLSWSQRNFSAIYGGWYPDHYDNRHKFTIMGNYKFSKKFELYAAWNYHSGNRLSAALYSTDERELFDMPNNVKLPDYHRLDIGMNIYKKTRRGRESIWNISIYNVYCRMNPISGNVYEQNGEYIINTIGLIPIIPNFSYTLKF